MLAWCYLAMASVRPALASAWPGHGPNKFGEKGLPTCGKPVISYIPHSIMRI